MFLVNGKDRLGKDRMGKERRGKVWFINHSITILMISKKTTGYLACVWIDYPKD